MNDRRYLIITLSLGWILILLLLSLVAVLAYQINLTHINDECEKELLRRDEPKGIVCSTKIQSIVTSNGDEQ